MKRRQLSIGTVLLALSLFAGGSTQVQAQGQGNANGKGKVRTTHADRQAAAQRAADAGLILPEMGVAQMADPTSAPHYFSVANYANSPLRVADATVEIVADPSEPVAPVAATAVADVDLLSGAILGVTITSPGSGYTIAPTVNILSAGGTGASATAALDVNGSVASIDLVSAGNGYVTKGIRKFVDGLPGLRSAGANLLGQYIPVAVPDTTKYPESDFYEIAVVQYTEKMHSDLPPTRLRGYVQLGGSIPLYYPDGTTQIYLPNGQPALAVEPPHYMGPFIVATKDKPVRILFRNLLPTGQAGNLFIPVDTTVMGSGMGPLMGGMDDPNPQEPMCGDLMKPDGCYTENRATLHLHGGITPWISDGTPHQWITPADENTPYPKGVSVVNVPDMEDPGPGAQTFFYSNQQSARLLFYHDHAWGITRLNVYVGEAAGYLIADPNGPEPQLVSQGLIPPETDMIPLIIQDKTFVPSMEQLAATDPDWDLSRWGKEGDLWVPHVYSPAQNPGDSSGVNQFGRWAYGPWFWPPTSQTKYPPIVNPYYDATCNPDLGWCEPPTIPSTPFVSMGMEAFNDTPMVNGTVYPVLKVEPKAYRFRILSAANDRFFNLSLYKAKANGDVWSGQTLLNVDAGEVDLNPTEVAAALTDPTVFPTPVAGTEGPDWIQIGTEGGFLPAPVVIPAHPITWVTDPTVFNAGNVDQHSLLLGPAERADVIVDFSQCAGQTLILYNDAPAAFPARDPRYDYYTGNPDLRETGGAPSTIPGYGPNTRTVMQIQVAASTPAAAYDTNVLIAAFAHPSKGGIGVFESTQHPIIVAQGAYNSAYGTSFPNSGAGQDGFVRITDFSFTFNTLAGPRLTFPLQPKAIQDEMGEAFDPVYGRMSGNLGLEAPSAQAGAQNLILYPYVNPATEVIDAAGLPKANVEVTPIASATDGTQIWKITHNGVDTHPIHFHLYDVQLVNRVGWDGIIRKPEANELGWKDTVRISPLEDTIVALRPIIPTAPFGLPDSKRPYNPMMPLGDQDGFNNVGPDGMPLAQPIVNQIANFGWEYVWHCHILSHEEMDMMRPVQVNVPKALPPAPILTGTRNNVGITLNWTDGTPASLNIADWGSPTAEVGFRLERATVAKNGKAGTYSVVARPLANQIQILDLAPDAASAYSYRVIAYNAAGDAVSAPVTVPALVSSPLAPSGVSLALLAGPTRVTVTWTDNATTETGFVLERSDNGLAFSQIGIAPIKTSTGVTSFTDNAPAMNHTYVYRIASFNASSTSAYSYSPAITVSIPAAPSNITATAVRSGSSARVTLNWADNANNETGFVIERATDAGFTLGLTQANVAANTTTLTQTGLPRNVNFYYRVQSRNALGNSASVNATPFPILTP